MNTATLLKTVTALPLVAMLALVGCGGGGSSSATKQLTALQEALGDTELTPEAITALITAQMMAESERNAAQTSRDAANAEVARLMSALQAAEDARDQALVDDQADQDNIDSLSAQIVDLTSQIADLNTEITGLNMQIAELTALEGQLAMADAELTRLMSALQAAEDARDQALADDQTDQATIDNLNAQIADLTSQIAELTQQIANLNRRFLEPGTGLVASGQTPIYATSVSDTMAELLPDSANAFAPLSSSLQVNYDSNEVSFTDSFSVKFIASDGNNGFTVIYVVGGVERSVTFLESDFNTSGDYYQTTAQDGTRYEIFAYTDSTRGSQKNQGSSEFGYFDAMGTYVNHPSASGPSDDRNYMTFGARTSSTNLPRGTEGTARYHGRMYADSLDNAAGDIRNNTARSRIQGALSLEVDFADATLEGRFSHLRVRPPGESTYTLLPGTTGMDITDGRIAEGRFTASLSGTDEDPNAPLDMSVRGYEGDVYGEFYGPSAEEVGGVLNAVRAEDNMVAAGWFGGSRFSAVKNLGTAAHVAGVARDFSAGRSELLLDDGMAQVERTANGWSVTVDGQTVAINDSDYNTHPRFQYLAWRDLGNNRTAGLWTRTRGFGGTPEFDYFDVKGWSVVTLVAGADIQTTDEADYVNSNYVIALHGDRTPESAMPTAGNATYSGRMDGREFPTDDAVSSNSQAITRYRAAMSLVANFGSASVVGEFSNIQTRPGDGRTYVALNGSETFDLGIVGNQLTTDTLARDTSLNSPWTGPLNGFGHMTARGAFFGPDADEVGGVFEMDRQTVEAMDSQTDNGVLIGWFGADKQ